MRFKPKNYSNSSNALVLIILISSFSFYTSCNESSEDAAVDPYASETEEGDEEFDDSEFSDEDFADDPECESSDSASEDDEYECYMTFTDFDETQEETLDAETTADRAPTFESNSRTYGGPGSKWRLIQNVSNKTLNFKEEEQKVVYKTSYTDLTNGFLNLTTTSLYVGGDMTASGLSGVVAGSTTTALEIPGAYFFLNKPVGPESEVEPSVIPMTKTGHCPGFSGDFIYIKMKGKSTGEDLSKDTFSGRVRYKVHGSDRYKGTFSKIVQRDIYGNMKSNGNPVDDVDSLKIDLSKTGDINFGGQVQCKKGVAKNKNGDVFYWGYEGQSATFKLKDGSIGFLQKYYTNIARDFSKSSEATVLGDRTVAFKTYHGMLTYPVDGKIQSLPVQVDTNNFGNLSVIISSYDPSAAKVGATVASADIPNANLNKANQDTSVNDMFYGTLQDASGKNGKPISCSTTNSLYGLGAADNRVVIMCSGLAPLEGNTTLRFSLVAKANR